MCFFVDLCLPLLIFVDCCWCVLIFCDIWRMLLILIIGEHQKGFLVRLISYYFPLVPKMLICIICSVFWCDVHAYLYYLLYLLRWFTWLIASCPLLVDVIYMFVCIVVIISWCGLHAPLHCFHYWFTCLFVVCS